MLLSKPLPHTPKQWFWLLEMGIMQSGLAYLFWNYALAHIKANTASILFLLTIIFTTINEVLFLGVNLNTYLVAGAIFICFSGYWITVHSPQKSNV
jgi:drug/metabolite transporter (DMT)-like permease